MIRFINQLLQSAYTYYEFQKVLSELNQLSPREASDLGLNRADFYRLAFDTVYGDVGQVSQEGSALARTTIQPPHVSKASV